MEDAPQNNDIRQSQTRRTVGRVKISPVGQGLQGGVHVAGVPDVLQSRQACVETGHTGGN